MLVSDDSVQGEAAAARPVGMNLRLRDQVLEITWADGVRSRFPLSFLRKHCPCASCRTERQNESPAALPVLNPGAGGQTPVVVGGNIVGNYALQLEWSDGHNTGIFDFRLLRSLHGQSGE